MSDILLPPSIRGEINIPFSRPTTPGAHPKQLAVLGLGNMGYIIARNLANSSSAPILVYNRTTSVAEKLVKEVGPNKAKIVHSVAEIAKEADIVLSCLGTDAVVKLVYDEIVKVLKSTERAEVGGKAKEKIFVESSTILPSVAGYVDSQVSSVPYTHFVACPVFGAPAAADKAELLLVMAGSYRQKKEVAYALVPAIGRKVIDLGGNVEKAYAMKLIGNSFILGMMEALAESMTLGEKMGVGVDTFSIFVKELFPSPIVRSYLDRMAYDDFDGKKNFSIEGGLKDAGHMRQLAQDHNVSVPTIDAAHRNMLTARALHAHHPTRHPILDWSALIAGPRVAAGLDGLDSKKHAKVIRKEAE